MRTTPSRSSPTKPAETATVYLDGAIVASGSTLATYTTGGQINLGQFVGGGFLSTSEFDDFRVYQGLLTGTQIAALSGATKPPAPTNLTGVGGNGFATLAWTGVSGAAYNLKRSLTSGGAVHDGCQQYRHNHLHRFGPDGRRDVLLRRDGGQYGGRKRKLQSGGGLRR